MSRDLGDGLCWADATLYDTDRLDCERAAHARTKARLACAERVLAGARSVVSPFTPVNDLALRSLVGSMEADLKRYDREYSPDGGSK